MAIADLFRRRPSAPALGPEAREAEGRRVAAEKRRDEAESRRESERRWYARLPIIAIATLSVAVAVLTLLMAIASPYTLIKTRETPASAETPQQKLPPPPAPAPVTIKMSLKNKALFGYNSSALRVVGDSAQRELDACLKPKLTRVHITGHADCIGSDAYNQGLSERRALAVGRYLGEKGVDAALITTEGKGAALSKADPLCSGVVRSTAANVTRLEPFRRVDVTCEYARQVMQI